MAAFVSRYARAFLDVVTSARLDTAAIDKQLADFEATWDGSPELQTFFRNPAVAAVQKVAILDKLNAKLGLQRELRNLLAVLINNDRIGQVHEVAAAYRAELRARLGIREAEIVTARELGDDERNTLIAGVGKLAGARVEAIFKLDRSILGGAVVRIGSTIYDGSVRGRLERLREVLVAG
ncbi:MAG TPA: ATP synthase F1 subunit delta [Terracidiphilus sp.]|jgi:F-type H+-transporting ATPase subunit delta|nr:ATP synthase F1 subunit delta [Terracidiphilus sp.]